MYLTRQPKSQSESPPGCRLEMQFGPRPTRSFDELCGKQWGADIRRCLVFLATGLVVAMMLGCDMARRDSSPSGSSAEWLLSNRTDQKEARGGLSGSVREAGRGEDEVTESWSKVLEPRPMNFPRDHGVHPEFQIEWWYFTGNLWTAEGRRFGYQLTFFRTGIQREPTNPSRWAVRDLYTAHFALSDVQGRELRQFERSSRGGIDWAGADEVPGRVWNGDWQWSLDGDHHRLEAREGQDAIRLDLRPRKAPAVHDQQGLSRKGAEPGNASYYYSLTRLETEGRIELDGVTHEVTGWSWMDHEFSSSFLEKGQLGWDWFSIQFDHDHELMVYQIRRDTGEVDPFSSGTLVDPDGSLTVLEVDDYKLTPLEHWKSPTSSGRYPIAWRLEVPSRGLDLEVRATFPSQEMDTRESTGIIYWEGTIDVTGRQGEMGVRGTGYLEMTGYAQSDLGGLLERD